MLDFFPYIENNYKPVTLVKVQQNLKQGWKY